MLAPAIRKLRTLFGAGAVISADTRKAQAAEAALEAGADIINDVSGLGDPAMAGVVARHGAGLVLMHSRGTPETMQSLTDYPKGVTAEVLRYFKAFARRAAKAGITDWILDPGFGFAKTVEQNWTLLEELDRLQALQQPILVGISRKSMIYKRFGITPEEALPATQVAHLLALQRGATWLRVHDVAETVRTALNR